MDLLGFVALTGNGATVNGVTVSGATENGAAVTGTLFGFWPSVGFVASCLDTKIGGYSASKLYQASCME